MLISIHELYLTLFRFNEKIHPFIKGITNHSIFYFFMKLGHKPIPLMAQLQRRGIRRGINIVWHIIGKRFNLCRLPVIDLLQKNPSDPLQVRLAQIHSLLSHQVYRNC
eukprot:TRINITY_DN43935_c0_g1_i2.p1 TRINITY_DN43935_c0_g1~~TRINITY_DN43935_c0_g1_i2.p1  ORF type:complete len:108 (-),score=2.46 TRINITY_DN43935_c0_g1_i2:123-446(-)